MLQTMLTLYRFKTGYNSNIYIPNQLLEFKMRYSVNDYASNYTKTLFFSIEMVDKR